MKKNRTLKTDRKRNIAIILMLIIFDKLYAMAQADSLLINKKQLKEEIAITEHDLLHSYAPDTLQIHMPDSVTCVGLPDQDHFISIYHKPYSVTAKAYDWHRLWINTAALSSAFVGTLLVLECLPEDATSWNRAELQDVPLFKRWRNHVLKKGPEWDHDKFYFNYILHPYAGAVYYMSARSCGFNAWQSLLYCSLISNVGWEFGIEAFMERPSYQDMLITPLVGSLIGEGFYKAKRHIVNNGYRLLGSSVLGNVTAFLIDPVNEVMGLFTGNPARKKPQRKAASASVSSSFIVPNHNTCRLGFSLCATF